MDTFAEETLHMVSVEYLCVCMSFFIYWQLPGLVSVQQLENMTELTNGNLTTLLVTFIPFQQTFARFLSLRS